MSDIENSLDIQSLKIDAATKFNVLISDDDPILISAYIFQSTLEQSLKLIYEHNEKLKKDLISQRLIFKDEDLKNANSVVSQGARHIVNVFEKKLENINTINNNIEKVINIYDNFNELTQNSYKNNSYGSYFYMAIGFSISLNIFLLIALLYIVK